MLKNLLLSNVGPSRSLQIDFANRITAFTGDNGLGKSFILEIGWWALTRTWSGNPALPSPSAKSASIEYTVVPQSRKAVTFKSNFDRRAQVWSTRQGRPPMPGLVVFARSDGGFSVWDPARNYWRRLANYDINNPDRPSAFHFSDWNIWNGLRENGNVHCNGILEDWIVWQSRKTQEYKLLCQVLDHLSPSEEEPIAPGEPTRIGIDVRNIPTIRMPYGDVPITHTSAGMRRILAFAYLLVWAWSEHKVAAHRLGEYNCNSVTFLIDEIEAHLHPKWQQRIVPALLSVVTNLSSELTTQLIIATHSPLIVLSLEMQARIELDSLYVFELMDNSVSVERMSWNKMGDVATTLQSEIFGLTSARSLDVEAVIDRAQKAVRSRSITKGQFKKLQNELSDVLDDDDPFWPRWLLKGRSLGFIE